jgi:hypothetical protein
VALEMAGGHLVQQVADEMTGGHPRPKPLASSKPPTAEDTAQPPQPSDRDQYD